MDLLAQGSAWLEDQRTRFMTRSVTYTRGSQTVTVAATIGKSTFDVADGDGAIIQLHTRDFLILAADLVLAGQRTTPHVGDRIHDAGVVFEVLAPGGEAPWRWSDPYRQTLRIHTKQVASE